MSNKKQNSPLVQSVLALDQHLSELERVGDKINSTDMTTDVDMEHMQKLLTRFAECGKGVSEQVMNLSRLLNEARQRAEDVSRNVSIQIERLNVRTTEQNEKMERFRLLGERVRELNAAISEFRRPKGQSLTEEDRAKLAASIPAFDAELSVLIEELLALGQSARDSRMKSLQKNAESLAQTLQSVRKKLVDWGPPEGGLPN
jgi:hypothetical protein